MCLTGRNRRLNIRRCGAYLCLGARMFLSAIVCLCAAIASVSASDFGRMFLNQCRLDCGTGCAVSFGQDSKR
jgi:hypothetical protein